MCSSPEWATWLTQAYATTTTTSALQIAPGRRLSCKQCRWRCSIVVNCHRGKPHGNQEPLHQPLVSMHVSHPSLCQIAAHGGRQWCPPKPWAHIQLRKRNLRRHSSHLDCPRPECPKKVGNNEPVIQCDSCDKWWHARCGGLSDAQHTTLETDESSIWHCPSCPQLHRNDPAPKVPPIRLKRVKGKWRVNNTPAR